MLNKLQHGLTYLISLHSIRPTTEAYDAEASTWALHPEHLDKLHNAVSILGNKAGSFSFIAFFLGSERPEEARESTLQELKNDIENNRVRNNTLYSINIP